MKNKTLLITGANGQLATDYQMSQPLDNWDYLFMTREELDITNINNVQELVNNFSIDAILNLAAYTNVEKAEKEDTEKCFNVNATGPKNLALVCNNNNIPLIHISTDYVFDGEKESPYTENDIENPINQYGRTKFIGEKWIQENHDWYYIVRTSWVYSNNSKNFYTTMLNLAQERSEVNVVDDQYGSPTSTIELCQAIDKILLDLDKSKSGVYHLSGLGKTTWKDFTIEIYSQIKVEVKVNSISSTSWKSIVKRPVNSYLSSEKFANTFNYYPKHWKNALRDVISKRKIVPIKVGDIVISNDIKHIIVSTDWLRRVAMVAPLENINESTEMSFNMLQINGN
jgi:dTDP-4-dehydrorhamnose reductase